jgi:hypothetical protein
VTARLLTDADSDSVWRLSQLVFGWLGGEVPPTLQGQTVVGVDGPGGLIGSARLRSYEQWWGGRRVRMGGLAGVAVHPHARGQGAVRSMVAELLALMRDGQQPVSVLFPTAPGDLPAARLGGRRQPRRHDHPDRRVPAGRWRR